MAIFGYDRKYNAFWHRTWNLMTLHDDDPNTMSADKDNGANNDAGVVTVVPRSE